MGPLGIGLLAQAPRILGGFISGFGQRRRSRLIKGNDPTYKVSESAKEQLGLARNAFNARMPGADAAEQNILTGQANQLANVGRNATDSTQALAVAAGLQGQTNQSLIDLGQAEGANKNSQQAMLMQALQNMSNEERMVFEDKLRKYQEAIGAKNELMRSGMINQQNSFNEIGSIGALYASGLFGDNGTNASSAGGQSQTTGQTPEEMAASYTRRRGLLMPRLRF